MSEAKNSLLSLEKHRLQLEENVNQLRKTLQHWQTWDAEYESLKEEVEATPDPCMPDDLHKIHQDFDGELLTPKEIAEIFGIQQLKPREQILGVLQRRIDYVSRNVDSLNKQLETAEGKFADGTLISQTDSRDGHDQPLTEIIEELDNDDNVLSYRLNQPGESMPKIRHALEKVGIDTALQAAEPTSAATPTSTLSERTNGLGDPSSRLEPLPSTKAPVSHVSPSPSAKKSVSFSEQVDVQPSNPPPAQMSAKAKRVDRIMKTAKEQESISNEEAVIPEDEDSDDADLRKQMLKYSMGEVGAVVAELELEEVNSDDDSGFDYGEDGFASDDDDDDEDEDKYGRSTGRMVTDQYRQRMLELEQKLGIKSRFTEQAEQQMEEDNSDDHTEGIGRILVKKETGIVSSASKPAPSKSSIKDKNDGNGEGKKGVRFASALDVAPEDEPAVPRPVVEKETPLVEPLGDVVERIGSSKFSATKSTRKTSRFKQARDDVATNAGIPKGPFDIPTGFVSQEQRVTPSGPEGATVAERLVEREISSNVVAPDELDDSLAHQEVADEHHRLRRKFIQRDGGFLKEDTSIIQPLDEADGGEPVSRFKAARLSRQ